MTILKTIVYKNVLSIICKCYRGIQYVLNDILLLNIFGNMLVKFCLELIIFVQNENIADEIDSLSMNNLWRI